MLEGAIDARAFNTVRSSGKSLVIKSSTPDVLKGECPLKMGPVLGTPSGDGMIEIDGKSCKKHVFVNFHCFVFVLYI